MNSFYNQVLHCIGRHLQLGAIPICGKLEPRLRTLKTISEMDWNWCYSWKSFQVCFKIAPCQDIFPTQNLPHGFSMSCQFWLQKLLLIEMQHLLLIAALLIVSQKNLCKFEKRKRKERKANAKIEEEKYSYNHNACASNQFLVPMDRSQFCFLFVVSGIALSIFKYNFNTC